nr:MAG TPA: hypothetical protein [Caudoviricetes sp.]
MPNITCSLSKQSAPAVPSVGAFFTMKIKKVHIVFFFLDKRNTMY